MQRYFPLKIILIFTLFLFVVSIADGFAGWYDPNWSTRRPIKLDNTSNNDTLYNFQVKMNIPYYSNMQADFDDIRFTTDDSVSSIPYWLEECHPSDYAIVYVMIPTIPALDTTIIFLYYGNPDALSDSDGEAVFEFFDDFNDQDISDWMVLSGNWTAENYFLEQLLTANLCRILSPYSNLDASVTEATMAYLSTYQYAGNHILFATDYSADYGYYFGFDGVSGGGEGTCIARITSGSANILVSDPTINVIDYAYARLKAKITYDGTGNFTFLLKAPDSVQVFLNVYDPVYTTPFILGSWVGHHIGINKLRVRKYTDVEPTYEIGGEQSQGIEDNNVKNSTLLKPTLSLISSNLCFPAEFLLELSKESKISADVYDCSGRKVASLITSQNLKSGKHCLIFEKERYGLNSGILFLRLIINEYDGETYYLNEKLLFMR